MINKQKEKKLQNSIKLMLELNIKKQSTESIEFTKRMNNLPIELKWNSISNLEETTTVIKCLQLKEEQFQ